jgi:hypothetical protein
MSPKERLRERLAGDLSPEQIQKRAHEGWRMVAVEWERASDAASGEAGRLKEAIPYGLRVSDDNHHLEEDPREKEALTLMLEMIADDRALSEVADGLNVNGLPTRDGADWSQIDVFEMLPRLVEVAPQIFATERWKARRATESAVRLMG